MGDRGDSDSDEFLSDRIARAVSAGDLTDDPAQKGAIAAFDRLLTDLRAIKPANKKSALGWMFGQSKSRTVESARGIYLWGGVGRGKSMLMDTFFDMAPVTAKRRVHFHAFMQDVHGRIHEWRQSHQKHKHKDADPIPPVADALAEKAKLLCFDEFAVTDVADAMILARLFTHLFERGVTIVATSNVEPDLLYKDGLNRSWFLPFIELTKTRMDVVNLVSDTDHRMEKLINAEVYMTGKGSTERFEGLWQKMVAGLAVEPASVEVAGRETVFNESSGGLVKAHFDDLCRKPLGAGDYLAMADRFHTLFLQGVPIMAHEDRNALKRFIALIDTWYDRHKLLIVEAAERPSALYTADHGTEAFEFDRTISRLREMQSDEWRGADGVVDSQTTNRPD